MIRTSSYSIEKQTIPKPWQARHANWIRYWSNTAHIGRYTLSGAYRKKSYTSMLLCFLKSFRVDLLYYWVDYVLSHYSVSKLHFWNYDSRFRISRWGSIASSWPLHQSIHRVKHNKTCASSSRSVRGNRPCGYPDILTQGWLSAMNDSFKDTLGLSIASRVQTREVGIWSLVKPPNDSAWNLYPWHWDWFTLTVA